MSLGYLNVERIMLSTGGKNSQGAQFAFEILLALWIFFGVNGVYCNT